MVAIDRYLRAQGLGRLDDERAIRHVDLLAVDQQLDHLRFAHATPATAGLSGQPPCVTCASNSSGKRRSTESKNGMIESPSGHRFVPVNVLLMTPSTRRSLSDPSPASSRDTMRATHWPPSRHGVH